MPDWSQICEFMDFCAAYYTTQLTRCAVISFVLIGPVMLLRKLLFSKSVFFRGMLWTLFLFVPFLGRLKLFYENKAVVDLTWSLTAATMSWIWLDRIYMAGILTAAVCICKKRFCLLRAVGRMEQAFLEHRQIRVTDMHVTPFTVGLLEPKIVIPKIMLDSYRREELRVVIRHEQTHIRLGHLWFGFAWDILRSLLWVNPFLTMLQKYVQQDMEDICDRVCMQSSGKTAYEYGRLLLKTLKLLRFESEGTPPAVTYAGEKEFADIKRRMGAIAGFRPCSKKKLLGMLSAAFLAIAGILSAVHTHSYARCNDSRDILIGSYDGKPEIVSDDTEKLRQMISYDDRYVYVEKQAFEGFLEKNHADGEIWIVFGGFYKLPGLGGAAEACIYEGSSIDGMVRIPYESVMEHWYLKLVRWL